MATSANWTGRRLGGRDGRMTLALLALAACSSRKATTPDAAAFGDAGHSASSSAAQKDSGNALEEPGTCTGPMLTKLDVSPLTLEPPFSPCIHDYVVRCAEGNNALQVSIAASSGAMTTVVQPDTSGPASSQSVSLNLVEDQAVVVNATSGSDTTPYWVRCLPHDFPLTRMSLHPGAGRPPPGYYFLGNTFLPSPDAGRDDGGYAMVLDLNGTPVWYGKTFNNAGAKTVDLLDSKTISYIPIAGYTFGSYLGSWEIHSLDPVGVKYVTAVGVPVDTHELRRLPNGDFIFFTDHIVTNVDLREADVGGLGKHGDVLDCAIQEVDAAGKVVWSWDAMDHFDVVREWTFHTVQATRNDAGTQVTLADPFHCNSIDWDGDGNLLISARDMDAVFLIRRSDGKVLWKMGGTVNNKDDAPHIQLVGDSVGGFYRQHHVRFVPDGTITVFDDETSGGGPARALQLSYDVHAGTASVVWQYAFPGGANSIGMGSVTILPDGSHVIGWGYPPGGSPLAFTETDKDGHDLLDFYFPEVPESSYRALKYPASAVDLPTMRASIGPWSSRKGMMDAGTDGGDAGKLADGGRDATKDAAHD